MSNNLNLVIDSNIEQTNILRGNNISLQKEDNSSKITNDFFKTFIKIFVLAKWHYQINAKKYQKKNPKKPTKNDIFLSNTKKLFNSTANVFAEHKANYLYDLFDLMAQMPQKSEIKHDKNFGSIRIINNKTLNAKSMKKIKFLSKLYFILKINFSLKDILIESINKMKENKNKRY